MTIQRDYERSVRRFREAVRRIEHLGYVLPDNAVRIVENLKPPQEVLSRKYLVMLLLFSQTCESLSTGLDVREHLVAKLATLSRRSPTPVILAKIRRLDTLVISQDKNIESQRCLLEYRGSVLLDILAGNEPNSRYI